MEKSHLMCTGDPHNMRAFSAGSSARRQRTMFHEHIGGCKNFIKPAVRFTRYRSVISRTDCSTGAKPKMKCSVIPSRRTSRFVDRAIPANRSIANASNYSTSTKLRPRSASYWAIAPVAVGKAGQLSGRGHSSPSPNLTTKAQKPADVKFGRTAGGHLPVEQCPDRHVRAEDHVAEPGIP